MIKSCKDIWYVGARVQTYNTYFLHLKCVSFVVTLYERKQSEILFYSLKMYGVWLVPKITKLKKIIIKLYIISHFNYTVEYVQYVLTQ